MKKNISDKSHHKNLFATNLKRYMNCKQVTQVMIAKAIGTSQGMVSDWCNGKVMPRMNKAQALANYLEISISDLYEDKPIIKERISKEQQKFLDLYDEIPEEKRALAIDLLRTLKSK